MESEEESKNLLPIGFLLFPPPHKGLEVLGSHYQHGETIASREVCRCPRLSASSLGLTPLLQPLLAT